MKDLGSLMKQAQKMQEDLQAAQAKLQAASVEGTAGGGMVKVELSGAGALKAVTIDPELLKPEEAEVVADLLVAAHADAKRRLDEMQQDMMKQVAGPLAGMNIPGLNF